jgi:hypothetical protein
MAGRCEPSAGAGRIRPRGPGECPGILGGGLAAGQKRQVRDAVRFRLGRKQRECVEGAAVEILVGEIPAGLLERVGEPAAGGGGRVADQRVVTPPADGDARPGGELSPVKGDWNRWHGDEGYGRDPVKKHRRGNPVPPVNTRDRLQQHPMLEPGKKRPARMKSSAGLGCCVGTRFRRNGIAAPERADHRPHSRPGCYRGQAT